MPRAFPYGDNPCHGLCIAGLLPAEASLCLTACCCSSGRAILLRHGSHGLCVEIAAESKGMHDFSKQYPLLPCSFYSFPIISIWVGHPVWQVLWEKWKHLGDVYFPWCPQCSGYNSTVGLIAEYRLGEAPRSCFFWCYRWPSVSNHSGGIFPARFGLMKMEHSYSWILIYSEGGSYSTCHYGIL